MNRLSDQVLISLYVTTKNDLCFAQLYTRHRYRVYQRCLFFCEDPDEANDFTQEVFIRLTSKLAGFKGESGFTAWLQVVTTNYCIDQVRKRQQYQLKYQQYLNENYLSNQNFDDSDEKPFRILEQTMQELSDYQRDLLRMKYQEGVEIKTIARQQKATLSAVKMRIKRAREQAKSRYINLYAEAE
ncbi:RNA polymerase sigma factor [Spirosoma migulaei]